MVLVINKRICVLLEILGVLICALLNILQIAGITESILIQWITCFLIHL